MISYIRLYALYGRVYYDIIYQSGRTRTCDIEDLPKTALEFINSADMRDHYNRIYRRNEIIFE